MTKVNCGACTACCRNHSAVVLHELLGDDLSFYRADMKMVPATSTLHGKPDFAPTLATKANGDCWYVGESGCTIYEQRPYVCRQFDCRKWLLNPKQTHDLDQSVELAARQRLDTLSITERQHAKSDTFAREEQQERKRVRKLYRQRVLDRVVAEERVSA
jgi:Fe-S-cluster containining protein